MFTGNKLNRLHQLKKQGYKSVDYFILTCNETPISKVIAGCQITSTELSKIWVRIKKVASTWQQCQGKNCTYNIFILCSKLSRNDCAKFQKIPLKLSWDIAFMNMNIEVKLQ